MIDEEAIRRDERRRVATLLEDHADTLCTFTGEGGSRATLGLVVLLLRLGEDVQTLAAGLRDPEHQP